MQTHSTMQSLAPSTNAAALVAHRPHVARAFIDPADRWGVTPGAPPDGRYQIRIDRRIADLADRLRGSLQSMTATAFQTPVWLAAWYATIGVATGEPMLVTIFESCSGEIAAILPLVRRTDSRLNIVEFADAGVSDNNAPILGPAAPIDTAGASALWLALCKALPGVDLLRFTKMPMQIDGRINPFVLIESCHGASVNRNVVTIEASWERYLKSLERRFRKELGRSWRVFLGHDGAAFRRIDGRDEALRILAELERQQSEHMHERRADYILDRPEVVEFYRKLMLDGMADGSVMLTALTRGSEVVAALLGIARGDTYVMIRISSGSREWSNCSPGRLVIVQTMQLLHAQGYRHFDFSIGNYAYKRRLGVEPEPLRDLVTALSPYGLPLQIWDRVVHFIRRNETLHAMARRILGRKPAAESEIS